MSLFQFIAILVIPFSATSCTQHTATSPTSPADTSGTIARHVDVGTFSSILKSTPDHILLDVRSPEETSQSKLPNAQEINFYQEDFLAMVNQLPKDKPVLVYCRSGNRSGQAMEKMKDLGFIEVYNLIGGIKAWKAAGLPLH